MDEALIVLAVVNLLGAGLGLLLFVVPGAFAAGVMLFVGCIGRAAIFAGIGALIKEARRIRVAGETSAAIAKAGATVDQPLMPPPPISARPPPPWPPTGANARIRREPR